MGTVAANPQSRGRNMSATKPRPMKINQKILRSTSPIVCAAGPPRQLEAGREGRPLRWIAPSHPVGYNTPMKHSLQEVAEAVGARLVGEPMLPVKRVASIASARTGDLVFVEDEKMLSAALESGATAVITGEYAGPQNPGKPLLIARHPRLAFARAAALLYPRAKIVGGAHSSAVIASTARLGQSVWVGAHVTLADDVVIGDRVQFGPGTVIGTGVTVGDDCSFAANVTVYPGVRIGNRVVVHAGAVLGSDGFGYVRDPDTGRYEKFPQIGGLAIADDVEIGANTTVDRGALDLTSIGRGTKLDNLVHVGHNVRIGEDVVIAAQTGLSGSAVVEDGAVIAGQVGIADHVRIGSGAILGAQCGVPSNKVIRGPGIVFWGTPARPIRQYLKELAVLARLARKH
jgi:UDP-3-O-[3-hydroxymyristoyl] glucosamine N-acyltransferase